MNPVKEILSCEWRSSLKPNSRLSDDNRATLCLNTLWDHDHLHSNAFLFWDWVMSFNPKTRGHLEQRGTAEDISRLKCEYSNLSYFFFLSTFKKNNLACSWTIKVSELKHYCYRVLGQLHFKQFSETCWIQSKNINKISISEEKNSFLPKSTAHPDYMQTSDC